MSAPSQSYSHLSDGTTPVDAIGNGSSMMTNVRAAVLSCAVLATVGGVLLLREQRSSPLERLVSEVPRDVRNLEVRLTGGFPWRRLASPSRASTRQGAANAKLAVAATRVATDLDARTDAEATHVSGIAHLLGGRADLALQRLQRAVEINPSNASAWSDLASARFVAATEEDQPIDLPPALAAADHALGLNPVLPEALFNRAVIIEHLGLRHHAAAAWRDYLAVDATSEWADEARGRLAIADRPAAASTYKTAAVSAEAAAIAGDVVAIRAFVDAYRQQSRASAELEVLGRWAEAEIAGNAERVAAELTFATAIGNVLQSTTGETLLLEAVQAIQNADATERQLLAAGHQTYFQARELFRDRLYAQAEPVFLQAVEELDLGGSPMADVARYYLASSINNQQRKEEARTQLLALAANIPSGRRSLDAHVHWELGLIDSVAAQWTEAFENYHHASELFEALGEVGNHGFLRNLLASTYESVGDREQSWEERVSAFALMSDEGAGNRLQVGINSAARSELLAGRLEAAASLLQLAVAESSLASTQETSALAYGTHAEVDARLGDQPAARRNLADARALLAKISDPATNARVKAMLQVNEARIIRENEPARSLTLLGEAARHYETTDRRFLLPNVRLQRAKALRALGREDEALKEIIAGIAELEKHRQAVASAEMRAGVLDAGEGLFAEAVDLFTRRSDFASAFSIAERWRARTVRESVALRSSAAAPTPSLAATQAALPDGAVLLEYAVLEDRLILFALTRNRFETFVRPVTQKQLRQVAESFTAAVRERKPIAEVRKRAADAHEILLAPAALVVSSAKTVIFVPDRFLQLVPYAAFFNPQTGRFVIQDYEVAIVPAAHMLVLLTGAKRGAPERDAFVIGEPATHGEFPSLAGAQREARTVATLYGDSAVGGKDATRELFASTWGSASIVHFAGHASSAPTRGAAAALALSGRDGADFLYAHEIARMQPRATELVVLAACDTFAGTKEHLEGAQTLSHAFLAAGVPSVVGTLWPIDDGLAHGMFASFHQSYVAGLPAVSALRQAQLGQLADEDERARHPASWAGAEILGNPWQTFSPMRRKP